MTEQVPEPRYRCPNCRHVFAEFLKSPHPHLPSDYVFCCPNCKEVFGNATERLCDEPGCDKRATVHWVSETGSRWTCQQHCGE